jgi:hypothetical protein
VKFRRYDGDGFSLDSAEQEVSSEALFHESQPAMAEASDGSFLFAWTGSEDGSTTQIFARLFNASAEPIGANFIFPSDPCYQNYDPQVAWTEGEGKFVLVWERLCPGDFFSQVAATLVDPDDLSTVPEPLALAADAEEVFSPSVSTSFLPAVPTGEIPVPPVPDEHIILFAWAATSSSADPADGPYDILSQRFTVDTLGLSAFDTDPVLMATINRFEQNSPAGAFNAGRFLIITWTDYSLSGSDASYSSVRARFLPNGWFITE